MASFFIDRPIFAWVIAIVITLAGLLSISSLPLEQYPDIAPPSVTVRADYTGASAQTVENSVTQVIEQQMTGLDHLMYISSSSISSGKSRVTMTFTSEADPDTSLMQVQNKVQQAESKLPEEVKNNGITVTKSSGNTFMMVAFDSTDGSLSKTDIADYMVSAIQDPISRVSGVGDVDVMGTKYAMRIWLNPEKLRTYSLMPSDVNAAIRAQNADLSSGQLGELPAVQDQGINVTVTSRSRLQTADEFRQIVLKAEPNGALVHLADVAEVELGSENYRVMSTFNDRPAAGIGIELASGANALQVADAVQARLAELAEYFPPKLRYRVAMDTTPFIKLSIEEVAHTLFEAILLVVLIMYLFLQNWRATLIPAIAVPVVLMGTFGVLALLGFSVNTLTMFAMVLAIGLLVDDAIVVVENVERVMQQEHLAPREATRISMGQISGALVGIALVLTAVFLPMAFFGGSIGMIYRQFSVTIASAMILSVIVAVTLTPALCASILRPHPGHVAQARASLLKRFFAAFNHGFDRTADRYQGAVAGLLKRRKLGLAAYLVLLGLLGLLFVLLPTSFLPEEDQGTVIVQAKLPSGTPMQRTQAIMQRVTRYALEQPEVDTVMANSGSGGGGVTSQNAALAYIKLKDWSERRASAQEVADRVAQAMGDIPDVQIFTSTPAGIPGMGQSGGFTFQLQDLGGTGHDRLLAARDKLLRAAADDPALHNVRYSSVEDSASFLINIDDAKASALGLDIGDINAALSTALGGSYVNDFINRGRIKQVYVQGQADSRMLPADIGRWTVRNKDGDMVPFAAFSSYQWTFAPAVLTRFNGSSSMEINGQAADGYSSGTAMAHMEKLVAKVAPDMGFAWSGMSYQERLAGNQASMLYAVSLLFVFLCLAALYESWSIPFSVMLAVPVGVLGAILFTLLRGLSSDIYFQVGLLATIGLAAKNGILIVEFARDLEHLGRSPIAATLEAARQRLRPIIITSSAFLLGVLPLLISSGAGSGGRHSLGTGVFGGTLVSTLLGIFFVPLFYVLVRSLFPGQGQAPAQPGREGDLS